MNKLDLQELPWSQLPGAPAAGSSQDDPIELDSDVDEPSPPTSPSSSPMPEPSDEEDAAAPAAPAPSPVVAAAAADPDADYAGENSYDGKTGFTRWMVTIHARPGEAPYIPNFDDKNVLFATYQVERCPRTGRVHTHIYVRFANRRKWQTVKKYFRRDDAHLDICKGTEKQCCDYVEKEESRLQRGERFRPERYDEKIGTQGRRSDLEDVAEKCIARQPLRAIAVAHPAAFIRYHAGIERMHQLVAPEPPSVRRLQVICYWGDTGTGKTWRATHNFGKFYKVTFRQHCWDQYEAEDTVIFDEFDWTQWPVTEMNTLLDEYPLTLQARYRARSAAWTRVIICSNDSPASWYQNVSQPLLLAFRRRIANSCYICREHYKNDEQLENFPIF